MFSYVRVYIYTRLHSCVVDPEKAELLTLTSSVRTKFQTAPSQVDEVQILSGLTLLVTTKL